MAHTGFRVMRFAIALLAVALVACGEGDAVVSQTPVGAGGGGQAGGAGQAGAAGAAGQAGATSGGAAGSSGGAGVAGGAGSAGNPLCAEAFDPYSARTRHQLIRDANGLHVLGVDVDPKGKKPATHRFTTYAPASGARLKDRPLVPTSTAAAPVADPQGVATDGESHVAVLIFTTMKEVAGRDLLMLGSSDPGEDAWVEWSTPWSYPSTVAVHVGWDGEAFVVVAYSDASAGAQPGLYMARISREGVTVQGKTYIGENATLVPLDHEMRTDAKTGRTLYVATSSPGVWLGGFERDGTPLAPGGKLTKIKPTGDCQYGGGTPSVSASGGGVVASTTTQGGCIQGLSDTSVAWAVPLAAPVLKTKTGPLNDTPGSTALEEREGSWFAAIERYTGVYQRSIDMTGASSPESLLIKLNDCATTTCNTASTTEGFHLGVMRLTTARWQDELWLAYEDTTNSSNADAPGLPPIGALRMLRIAPGCTYRSSYLLHNP